MEDGLGGESAHFIYNNNKVLILVLMEDGLGVVVYDTKFKRNCVLILVLMEDGLGAHRILYPSVHHRCLNPCSNGRWSRSQLKNAQAASVLLS